MIKKIHRAAIGISLSLLSSTAWSLPPAPTTFCQTYPDLPACVGGAVECAMCHTTPPARNSFGDQLARELELPQGQPRRPQDFEQPLSQALITIEQLDADGDGASNIEELRAGSSPSDATSQPASALCDEGVVFRGYDVCRPDLDYVLKKVSLDFCGRSPSLEQLEALQEAQDPEAFIHQTLTRCLSSEHWIGKDGVVWNLANKKIAPQQTLKSGEGQDPRAIVLFADYDDDYNFFVHANTAGQDARALLTGDYFVRRYDRVGDEPTRYEAYMKTPLEDFRDRGFNEAQFVSRDRRAGMITHRWFLASNIMFTSLPRTAAAQAYRAYLGLDIAKLEGLAPIDGEPLDYDNKGVQAPDCAVCHSTLDPLTYPFSRYDGLGGGVGNFRGPAQYSAERLKAFEPLDGPSVSATPEAGYLLGEPVQDLIAWAKAGANSRAFAKTIVLDYWRLLFGEPPSALEQEEFERLVSDLMGVHQYSVEAMLHQLIFTEAYSVP